MGGPFSDFISSFYINTGGIRSSFGGQGVLGNTIGIVMNILNYLVYIILALAIVYFLWGVFKYVTTGSDSDREEAIQTITHGIIIIFVMVSLWSLVSILGRTFGLGYNGAPQLKSVNVNNLIK
jgi:hypothetical protein